MDTSGKVGLANDSDQLFGSRVCREEAGNEVRAPYCRRGKAGTQAGTAGGHRPALPDEARAAADRAGANAAGVSGRGMVQPAGWKGGEIDRESTTLAASTGVTTCRCVGGEQPPKFGGKKRESA